MPHTRLIIFLAIIGMFVGCSDKQYDKRLTNIASIVADKPQEALSALDSISTGELTEYDRHYYDFLSIKAKDKAYITHTSDSLILNVIDWCESHDKDLYPEALYYGGRVYSDLGDYPTALRYFQDAIDNMPKNEDGALRRNMISQMGRLLIQLRLYQQALPYLKESLKLSTEMKDSLLAYDYQLLGCAYKNKNDYQNAEKCFATAFELTVSMPDDDRAFMQGYMASIKRLKGEYDSALVLIRTVPDRLHSTERDYFSAEAAEIYFKTQQYDSAYIYSRRVIESPNNSYRITGYRLLLSPELRSYTHPDTIFIYFNKYLRALESNYNQHDADAAIMQNSMYNYSLHEKKSTDLLQSRNRLLLLVIALLLLILSLLGTVLYLNRQNQQKKEKLLQAISNIRQLNHQLGNSTSGNDLAPIQSEPQAMNLQQQLYDEISQLKNTTKTLSSQLKPNNAIYTAGYKAIQTAIINKQILQPADPIWDCVNNSINAVSPNFESTLKRLSNNKLSTQDYQLAMLIRLEIHPAAIAMITGRVKGAITYRRNRLCQKCFYNMVTTSEMDEIIRSL